MGLGLVGFALLRGDGAAPGAQPPGPPVARAPATHSARPGRPRATRHVIRITRRMPPPARVRIPSIGVDARLVRLGLDNDGALEVPPRWEDAGWFTGAARPGERGAAVIAGHVDSTSGPAVFYRLGALRPGATVTIARRGASPVRFRVRRVERWPKRLFPTRRVYGPTRRPTLRLVTCGGAFDRASGHYVDNTIVFATVARDRLTR